MSEDSTSGGPLAPIDAISAKLDIPADALYRFGHDKAKISLDFVESLSDKPDGKLILVSAMTPTRYGEGKTTTSIGLADALSGIGRRTVVCLREPSLGPVFGMKGGGTGGGQSMMEPSKDINLHFTGDLHAITSAHNLLAALLDNHIYWGNELGIDARRVTWPRVMDMNERAMREVTLSLGGVANGFPRAGRFDITAASEIMAIICLAGSLDDLTERLGDIVVAQTRRKEPVTARELGAVGAMTVLLKDAMRPNLVQTRGGTPALVHGGPFANIAHGCSSVLATRLGLKLADYAVTEAGFGADLGAEKFLHIKCRSAGLTPSAAVVVATIRALKSHGGVEMDSIEKENTSAVEAGFANLIRHIENLRRFGLPVIVALNRFNTDTNAEVAKLINLCQAAGVDAEESTHFTDGGAGAVKLAEKVAAAAEGDATPLKFVYDEVTPLIGKVRAVAQTIYGAADIDVSAAAEAKFKELQTAGWGTLPICMAKTQYSFSADPALVGAPEGFNVPIREVRLSAGAGFIVAVCGAMMTMPGLPREPAAHGISLDNDGNIIGMM